MGSNAPTENEVTNENVEDEEEVITFDDLVNINESLERDAELLLGGQNDSICTYPEGYKYRQPLYACLTCTTENAGQLAGVCYACSCNCHDGHDLVEMFTKRKFCCDCGNSKFKSKCKLYEEKCEENVLNKYNDNFQRIYCVCKRTYPPLAVDEAEAEDAGEMHQCCICEDWFHLSHIFEGPALTEVVEQLQSQRDTEFDDGELLCRDCVARLPFLLHYTMKEKKEAEKKQQEEKVEDDMDKPASDESDGTTSATRSDGENVEPFTMRPAPSVDCKLEMMKAKHVDRHLTPESRYVGSTWRLALCRCTKCMNMYDVENCAFLVDPEDTMTHYDAERQRNMQLNGEPELAARTDGGRLADGVPTSSGSKHLGSDIENLMYDIVVKKTNNHDAALDAYLRVKQMYAHLGEFFTKCADKDKTITRRDVERCFEELQAKRPRLSTPSKDGAWTQ